ncbi:MAG: hypothetical protein FWH20_04880 [Oscillospiraceae bacterium]|nr:hypothetical protein [Oscillospiraceae bacterium]
MSKKLIAILLSVVIFTAGCSSDKGDTTPANPDVNSTRDTRDTPASDPASDTPETPETPASNPATDTPPTTPQTSGESVILAGMPQYDGSVDSAVAYIEWVVAMMEKADGLGSYEAITADLNAAPFAWDDVEVEGDEWAEETVYNLQNETTSVFSDLWVRIYGGKTSDNFYFSADSTVMRMDFQEIQADEIKAELISRGYTPISGYEEQALEWVFDDNFITAQVWFGTGHFSVTIFI